MVVLMLLMGCYQGGVIVIKQSGDGLSSTIHEHYCILHIKTPGS